ncbi:MAG: c-type cytochrome [Deltaproteobacteria bacterium]|nr:c-type cytochrome [Deltaproteobacteria bacterium]
MGKVIGKIFIFLLATVFVFMWVGYAVTKMTGGEKKAAGAVEITPEGGETIFWGKGRCFTCHSMGENGSAVRCPNLGVWGDKFPLPIGKRAESRAKERQAQTGLPYTATDYLTECLATPGAYIVEGYKNEMAVVYAPPISLSLHEIKAVILYLQSQGGEVDVNAVNNPSEIAKKLHDKISAAGAAGGGDPGHGEEVFKGSCVNCHMLKGEGGKIGPDLSNAGNKPLKFLSESILRPVDAITPGYETWVVETKDNTKAIGIKTKDDAQGVEILKATGDIVTVARADIKELTQDKTKSLMPEDMIEGLTVKDFQDVLAFMMMQKEKK